MLPPASLNEALYFHRVSHYYYLRDFVLLLVYLLNSISVSVQAENFNTAIKYRSDVE